MGKFGLLLCLALQFLSFASHWARMCLGTLVFGLNWVLSLTALQDLFLNFVLMSRWDTDTCMRILSFIPTSVRKFFRKNTLIFLISCLVFFKNCFCVKRTKKCLWRFWSRDAALYKCFGFVMFCFCGYTHLARKKIALANARSVEKSLLCPFTEKTKLVTQVLGRKNDEMLYLK